MMELEPHEYVIYIARKHWFIFVLRLVVIGIAGFLPMILIPFFHLVPQLNNIEAYSLFAFFYLVYLSIIWMLLFLAWTDYYLDIGVITNKRIMDIEQKGLFNREVSSMRYEMIQDITTEIEGVVPTMLDYGDLFVQTAATTREFYLTQIAYPGKVKEIIITEMSKMLGDSNRKAGLGI